MKNLFKSAMLIAVAAMAFTSCSKENGVDSNPDANLIALTLTAGNPDIDGVRTELDGTTPYWSVGDRIGVGNGTTTNYVFTNTATERAQTTSFTGLTDVSSTIYTYYPYTTNGVGAVGGVTGAKVDIPVNQTPTTTSFDGKADILIGKPITLDASGKTVENLRFRRVGGILRVVLADASTGGMLADQHVASLSVTTDGTLHLAGRVVLDMINNTIGAPYSGESNTVTATYTSATEYLVNGTNATYLGVYPRTLPAGAKLTITASTEGYAINKEITLANDVVIIPGKITTMTINLADANITVAAAGMALPFVDDFSGITGSGDLIDLKTRKNANQQPLYSASAYIYSDGTDVIRFSSSSNTGILTTSELNLSAQFSVMIKAKAYGTDVTGIKVTAGEAAPQTIAALTTEYKTYMLTFDGVDAKAKIKIEPSVEKKRFLADNIEVIAGVGVLPPFINITSPVAENALAAGGSITTTYNIENPVEGTTISASAGDATWINDFVYTTAGQVSFTIDANETTEARTATVTFTYGTADAKAIIVNQAKPATGATKQYTLTIDPTTFTSTTTGSGYAAYNGAHPYVATAVDGSGDTYNVDINSTAVMTQSALIQFQKTNGVLLNTASWGAINSITINLKAGTFKVYEGTASSPTNEVTGVSNVYTFAEGMSFFSIKGSTSGAATANSITIVFTI